MLKKITAITAITLVSVSTLFGTTLNAAEVNTAMAEISSGEYTGATSVGTLEDSGKERSTTSFHYVNKTMQQGVEYYLDWTNPSSKAQAKLVHNDKNNLDTSTKVELFRKVGAGWKSQGYFNKTLTAKGQYNGIQQTTSSNVNAKMGVHSTLKSVEGKASALDMQLGYITTA